jgi:acyl-CoA thioester hydrolase
MQTKSFFKARYAETDQMGIIHHSNYAVWFEIGRTDFLKEEGFHYSEIEARGLCLPLYDLHCRFKAPAKYNDDIIIVTGLKQFSPVRLCFYYHVCNASNGESLATGETMHAWTDKSLKPVDVRKIAPDIYSVLERIAVQQ